MRKQLSWFVGGIAVAIVLAILITELVISSGRYNVAATQPHARFVRRQLSRAMDRSAAFRSRSIVVPADFRNAANVRRGAGEYVEMCEICHAAPGVHRSHIGEGLYPKPPDLAHSAREMPPAQLFWITKNGVKDTGMPAFGVTHADSTLWAITAFLEQLPDMTPAQYAAWKRQAEASQEGGGDADAAPVHTHEHGPEARNGPTPHDRR